MAKEKIDPEVLKWDRTISEYDRAFKAWCQRVTKIIKRYKDEGRLQSEDGAKFNILWSNVQTALPATFSRLPQPDVSRRFRDTDPVGRVAALLLERALEFEVEHYPDYRTTMCSGVQDRFLGGRGTAWVRYEPHSKAAAIQAPTDGVQATEDVDEPAEELDYECSPVDYVHWKDFGHAIARTWEEVPSVWRKVYMSRASLIERFGDEGNKIPLDTRPDTPQKMLGGEGDNQACIYEIWDKAGNEALWFSKSMGKILDRGTPGQDERLPEFDQFWPCPKPLFATLTTDSLIPVPDFSLYQDQARTLDILADRIEGLVKMLQVKGCYDASEQALARIFTEGGNGTMIPVKNWAAFVEKQGLKGAISLVELQPIYEALKACYEAVEQQKGVIYEITGLADIIRGQSDPRETAEAVKTKGQFGSMRLRAMQKDVGCFATEILQIKAQIICKQYDPQTIAQIGGANTLSQEDQQLLPQALQLLKNATLRDFRIEIVADSMIYMDEQQEKQDRMEFLNAVGTFMKEAIPAAQQSAEMAPVLIEMLKFAVSGFKIGKTLEGVMDAAVDKIKAAAANPQPKVDPEQVKAQGQMQIEQMKVQAQGQLEQQKMQAEAQRSQMETQAQMQLEQFKANLAAQVEQSKQQAQLEENTRAQQLEAQRAQQDAQLQAQVDQAKSQAEQATEMARLQFEKWKAELEAQTKIAVAEIAAKTTLQAAQMSAANREATSVTQ